MLIRSVPHLDAPALTLSAASLHGQDAPPSTISRRDALALLAACAPVTDAIKAVSVDTVGYNGLMLPPLEDPILAQRLSEGRYGVQELLLYSSVCGTGLDVVPLAHKWDKPLSARLFPVPGKEVGDFVEFDNPFLVDARVAPLD